MTSSKHIHYPIRILHVVTTMNRDESKIVCNWI